MRVEGGRWCDKKRGGNVGIFLSHSSLFCVKEVGRRVLNNS